MKSTMKHIIVKFVVGLCRITRAYHVLCPIRRGTGVILAMHRVIPDTGRPRIEANSRIEITPKFLESLIIFFREKGYEIISLDTMHARLVSGKRNRPFVCFTFDDGYSDILHHALPIFERHQAPFAAYVVTSFADRTTPLWWYMLEDLLLETEDELEIAIKGRACKVQAATLMDKEAAFSHIREILMKISQQDLADEVKKIFSPFGITSEDYRHHQMNWDQVSELARNPLATVSAHTVHHFNLKQLPPHEAMAEIQNSRSILEEKTKTTVHHFAYPFGSRVECGPREFEMARKCGFKTGVTVREGTIFPEHRHHTECLPRIEITGRHQDLTLVDMRRCGLISLVRNGLKRVVTD